MNAVRALQRELPDFEILPIPFKPKYLHLDCVFNILSSKDALIYPNALAPKIVSHLSSMYHLIEVSESEQFSMVTNVLSIGHNRVFSLPSWIDSIIQYTCNTGFMGGIILILPFKKD